MSRSSPDESYRVCVALTSPLTRHLHRPGISVYPPSNPETGRPDNTVLGKSSIAGTYAVGQTAASRVLTNMCVRDLWLLAASRDRESARADSAAFAPLLCACTRAARR